MFAESDQVGSAQQQEYAAQQLGAYHAGSADHGQLTSEGLAAALQMASDHALGLAAHVDGVDALDQVACRFWASLSVNAMRTSLCPCVLCRLVHCHAWPETFRFQWQCIQCSSLQHC